MICPVQLWAPQARESWGRGAQQDGGREGTEETAGREKWELSWELMEFRE